MTPGAWIIIGEAVLFVAYLGALAVAGYRQMKGEGVFDKGVR
jgi:hypothetical protein